MIEEKPIFDIHQKVLVKELGISGIIYESAVADSGNRIYGIRLEKVAWIHGLCTEVWHCPSEELEAVEEIVKAVSDDNL